jgi:hypothetical protein
LCARAAALRINIQVSIKGSDARSREFSQDRFQQNLLAKAASMEEANPVGIGLDTVVENPCFKRVVRAAPHPSANGGLIARVHGGDS